MAENCGFFNANKTNGVYDREYDASDFAKLFSMFFRNGVFVDPATNLKVVAKSGMTVTLKAGKAFINGYWYELTNDKDFTIGANSTSGIRTDSIRISLRSGSRDVAARYVPGSSTPSRTEYLHDLIVATIQVPAGTGTITDGMITDTRADEELCGYVAGVVDQIDATDLFAQYDSAFNEWFNDLKGKLEYDPATQLQQQITQLQQQNTQLQGVVNANKEELVPVEFLTIDNMSSIIRTGDLFGGTINTMHGIKVGNIITLTYQISNISRGGGDTTVFTLRDQKYFPVHYGIFPMYVGNANCAAYTGIFTDGRVTMSIIGGSYISSSNRTVVAGTITYATWGV